MEEVHMVVRVARRYHQLKLNFCVITFYDPQRAAIIRALENEDLPSDCVYNVDSFQGMWRSPCISVDISAAPSLRRSLIPNRRSNLVTGNEADYVILSSVRTKQPGFLKSQPRMNVALTRCCKGMVVVTDKSFLQGKGWSTLLGQLCSTWSSHHDACWIDSKAMLNNSGALPGLPTPAPPSRNVMHSHNLNGRTTMPIPARNPSSQTQTQNQTRTRTRMHQDQVSSLALETLSPSFVRSLRIEHQRRMAAAESARFIMSLSNPTNYQRRGSTSGGGHDHGHGGARSAAATVARRDLDDDEFPSLQPLANALPLDPTQSSRRQRGRKGRR